MTHGDHAPVHPWPSGPAGPQYPYGAPPPGGYPQYPQGYYAPGPYGPGAWLLLSLWSIAACVPIAWLLRRYLPLALGLSAASAARRIP